MFENFDFGETPEEKAAADMAAFEYRLAIADGIDAAMERLGGRDALVHMNDEGESFVNVGMLYTLAEVLSMYGMKAIIGQDDSGANAYAHAATVINVLGYRAEGRGANDFGDIERSLS